MASTTGTGQDWPQDGHGEESDDGGMGLSDATKARLLAIRRSTPDEQAEAYAASVIKEAKRREVQNAMPPFLDTVEEAHADLPTLLDVPAVPGRAVAEDDPLVPMLPARRLSRQAVPPPPAVWRPQPARGWRLLAWVRVQAGWLLARVRW